MHDRGLEKLNISPKWPKFILYSAKDKRECWGGQTGLGFQREGSQFTWRWRSKYSVNKCLQGDTET